MVYVLVIALTFDDYDLPMVPTFDNLVTLSGCTDATCGDHTASRFSMPLTSLGAKKYYLGIFFKVHTSIKISELLNKYMKKKNIRILLQANWYKAEQYCRFHGMHLARYALVLVGVW